LCPKLTICLISYENTCALVFIHFAIFFRIHTIDVTLGTEIFSPHFKASPTVNSHFKYMHLVSHEFFEVAMVNIKIMNPFPNTSSFFVKIEIGPQEI
jgi:hypothetical protein